MRPGAEKELWALPPEPWMLPGTPVHEMGSQAAVEGRGAESRNKERPRWAKPGQKAAGGSKEWRGRGLQDVCDGQQRRDGLLQQRRRLGACCGRSP